MKKLLFVLGMIFFNLCCVSWGRADWRLLGDYVGTSMTGWSDIAGDYIAIMDFDGMGPDTFKIKVKKWNYPSNWQQIGGTLNIQNDRNCMLPRIALDGNTPYVVFLDQPYPEFITDQIYMKYWNATTGNWEQLGSTSLNVNPSECAEEPKIAILNHTPYIIWYEGYKLGPDAGQKKIYVKYWNGQEWIQLGGNLINYPGEASYAGVPNMALIMQNGRITPYVTWKEVDLKTQINNIYVKCWDGNAWQSLGGSLNDSPNIWAFAPAITMNFGRPFVLFRQTMSTAPTSQAFVKYWNGKSWQKLGSNLNLPEEGDAGSPQIASCNGQLYAVLHTFRSSSRPEQECIYVKHWNGFQWETLGGNLKVNPTLFAGTPHISARPGHLRVIFDENFFPDITTTWLVYVKEYLPDLRQSEDAAPAIPGLDTSTLSPSTDIPVTENTDIPVSENDVLVFPNPGQTEVSFAYKIKGTAKVEIFIYNVAGEKVAEICENKSGTPGQALVTTWDASAIAPGVYFTRIVISDENGNPILNLNKKVAIKK